MLNLQTKIIAWLSVLALFGLIALYAREYPVFSNTIAVRWLVGLAFGLGALAGGAVLYGFRNRFTPWEKHVPETLLILAFSILFAPLFVSLLNRAGGTVEYQSFEFVSELPYIASNFGLLKGEKIKPAGYSLRIRDGQQMHRFLYKSQAY